MLRLHKFIYLFKTHVRVCISFSEILLNAFIQLEFSKNV